ncbi:MAG: metalloregulator ArsR/SmtB family transcription factor [Rhodospirillales bacterium]|jgi:rhodanese-related sulfurtransferase|nr:metalloregulator ArsR/SmtB family transcription factor [Rhodospirillales bacterium]
MQKPSPKKQIFALLGAMAKAMASGNRIELLEAVAQGERSVEELAQLSSLSVANTSHHLQVLRNAGLVVSRRQGVQIFYRLSDDEIATVLASLGKVAERQLDTVGRILREEFTSRDDVEPVSRADLIRRLKSGGVTVIDVRPSEEFEAGHIPGALNIPASALSRHLAELPKDREVVAYCRGPYCLLSFDAVRLLRRKGFKARRLADGFPEWRAEHKPVAKGA